MESVCNEKYVTTLKIKRKCNEKNFILFALRFCYAHGMKLNRMGGRFFMKENKTLEKSVADDGRQQAMLFSFCFVEGLFPFLVKSALCHIKITFSA